MVPSETKIYNEKSDETPHKSLNFPSFYIKQTIKLRVLHRFHTFDIIIYTPFIKFKENVIYYWDIANHNFTPVSQPVSPYFTPVSQKR